MYKGTKESEIHCFLHSRYTTGQQYNLFDIDIFYRESSLDELRVEPMESSPDGFGNGPRGFLTNEHVASEPLQGRVLRDEAEVAMIARMERAKRDVLQRVEIIVTGPLTFPWFTPVDHSKTLVRHLQDAALRDGRVLRVPNDPPNRLADDAGTFVRQRLHGTQVAQKVPFPFHFRRRGVEITVIHVDRVRRGEDTLSARS